MDDLIERLLKVESSRPDSVGISTSWHRNPDGPEAAARIATLEALVKGARPQVAHMAEEYQRRETWELLERIDATLARIKENSREP